MQFNALWLPFLQNLQYGALQGQGQGEGIEYAAVGGGGKVLIVW